MTIYRDRCREDQVLRVGPAVKEKSAGRPAVEPDSFPDRGRYLEPDDGKFVCRRCG